MTETSELSGERFALAAERRDDVVRLRVNGELDMAAVPALDRALTAVEAADTRLLIDLSAVTFLDSSGLRCLLDARGRADHRGYPFIVSGITPRVAKVLEITGTGDLLRSHEVPGGHVDDGEWHPVELDGTGNI